MNSSVEEKESTEKVVFPQDKENSQEDSSFDEKSTNLTHIGYNAQHHRVHHQPHVAEVQLLSEGQPRINNAPYNYHYPPTLICHDTDSQHLSKDYRQGGKFEPIPGKIIAHGEKKEQPNNNKQEISTVRLLYCNGEQEF